MINKVIIDKLKHVSDKKTCLAVLYSIHIGADKKMLRLCSKEIRELKQYSFIEVQEDQLVLVHPLFGKDVSNISDSPSSNLTEGLKKHKVEPVLEWIEEWRMLFPRTKKETGLIYLVRGDAIECAKRMKDFVNNYGYSKDTIFIATEFYLKEQKNKGWSFTKKSHKFIKDRDGSILSEYCELVENGDLKPSEGDSFINIV